MMENDNFYITMKLSDTNLLLIYLATLRLSLQKEWYIKEKIQQKQEEGIQVKKKRFSTSTLFIKEDTFSPNNEIILECFMLLDSKVEYTLEKLEEHPLIPKPKLKELYGILYSYNKIHPPTSQTIKRLVNLVQILLI
jgi:DNA-binding transcriptional ArsR family regulator